MPKARPVPEVDTDKTSAMLGPFAMPFALGYAFFRMSTAMSLFWADQMFAAHGARKEKNPDLSVPESVKSDKDEPELFA